MSVTIFKDRSFRGTSSTLPVGTHPNIKKTACIETVNSMIVDDDCQCTVFIDEDFRGACKVFKGKVSYVGDDFNDKVSSLIVEIIAKAPVYPATVYRDANFGGACMQLEVGDYSTLNIASEWNEQINSIAVIPGYTLIAYEDPNFQGNFRVFKGGCRYVGSNFKNKISSIQVLEEKKSR